MLIDSHVSILTNVREDNEMGALKHELGKGRDGGTVGKEGKWAGSPEGGSRCSLTDPYPWGKCEDWARKIPSRMEKHRYGVSFSWAGKRCHY